MRLRLHVPVHGELHLFLVVRNRLVDLVQLFAQLRRDVPAERRAYHSRSEMVTPRLRVPQHDRIVLGYMVQQHLQRMDLLEVGLSVEDLVVEDHVLLVQREVVRVAGN